MSGPRPAAGVPVGPLLREAAARLEEAGVPSAGPDAAQLLAHVLGVSRAALVLHGPVGGQAEERFRALLARRCRREPLQHLTGTAGFRHLELRVGPGVFVPRPETELLAGWAVERCRALVAEGRRPEVVDLCTGSGAIALAVATEVPEARVHAVELDAAAAAWAERNLAGSGVELRVGDMATAFPELDGAVDVVVANPPYIPVEAFEGVAAEARLHDPPLALWSGTDGLDAMRTVEEVAGRLLRPGGVVGAEHADAQGETAPAVFARTGRWAEVRDRVDLAGRPRFVTARRLAPGGAAPGTLTR